MKDEREIDWLNSTSRSLQASMPETSDFALMVTERLTTLLLERLPGEVASEAMTLLPPDSGNLIRRSSGRSAAPDASIAFPTFVELTRHLLGLTELLDSPKYAESEEAYARLCEQVAEAFLWAVAQELPLDLKHRMATHLPSDLRCRMNLYSGYSPQDKVA